jgi:hypothetical protein
MQITFILPGIGLSGGVKAVFEFANHLEKRGHKVSIIYPLVPLALSLKGKIRGTIGNLLRGLRPSWFDLRAKIIRVPTLAEKHIPKADIIMATWWQTAYCVGKYNENKGKKFYLVQHYETWGGPEEEVNGSYKLGLEMIINSTWLKDILEGKLKQKVKALILHAPDRSHFYPEIIKREKNKIRVLMPFRDLSWKGAEDGIEAFKIAKEKYSHIQLVMFGPKWNESVPSFAEFHLNPSNSELRKLYNSSSMFLFPSRSEGFGMPPMEAMACKIPVVATRVGAVPDYTIPGKTALISEPMDINGLAQNIIRLVENENERKSIAENGYNYIKHLTWEKATEQLEKVFIENYE